MYYWRTNIMKCDIQALSATHTMNKPFREEASCYVCRKYEVYTLAKELKPQMIWCSTLCYCIWLLYVACHLKVCVFPVWKIRSACVIFFVGSDSWNAMYLVSIEVYLALPRHVGSWWKSFRCVVPTIRICEITKILSRSYDRYRQV